ncbi:uncharacterized protein LOC120642699 [Panicum virgatum]|uniref:Uncharacterized protein n=1 Tax=Panicum virgatum TaxID=38727 RepID=A0A8T0QFC2_PANVG|nr:uncharacterized protein LOC120642699 [Panicum virgatum]KAG2573797.1 hypothetical protein PVAP13_7KG278910 [Panicum virgatum]
MKMEGKLKAKVEELKPLSAKKTEMEFMVRFLKAEIKARAESLEARLVAALAEEGELEDDLLAKKRECDLVKEKEEISITTTADPAAVICNFGNCANYAHMGEGEGDWESDWDWSQA